LRDTDAELTVRLTGGDMGGKSDMARARGRALRAVLAGTIVCWAVAEGVAVAQEAAEVTEDLGNSYLLARRTTSLGSIIETVLWGRFRSRSNPSCVT
jgi:hypothetical protein